MDPVVGPWCSGQEELQCLPALLVVVPVELLPLVMAPWVCKRVDVCQTSLWQNLETFLIGCEKGSTVCPQTIRVDASGARVFG